MATDTDGTSSTASKRRRLGKGLSGLIGDPVPVDRSPTTIEHGVAGPAGQPNEGSGPTHGTSPAGGSLTQISVDTLIPNRYQPRSSFDEAALRSLADSIARDGVMQPILVRAGSGSGSTGGRYEIIAGERRWRAAKLAGLTRVPAIVRQVDDETSAEWALIENVHRTDLNAIERADAIASLISRFGLTQAEAAERLQLERSTVANLVRLVDLEPAIKALIAQDRLSAGHGKALLAMPAGDERVRTAEAAAAGGWSVRRLEAAAKRPSAAPSAPSGPVSRRAAVLSSLERELGEELGTRVRIRTNPAGTKGRLEIDFFGLDHFDGLIERLGARRNGGTPGS
ncbi:MAG: ParB/RepB/Spo0J family partition protein [Phycisphaerales bacterium]